MEDFKVMIQGLIAACVMALVLSYGVWIGLSHIITDDGCISKLDRHAWARDYNARNAFFCTKCLTIKDFAKTAEVSLSSEVKIK